MTMSGFEISEDIKALIPKEKLESLIQLFAEVDTDQDGKIDVDEFLDATVAEEEKRLLKLFQTLDTDNDGAIDFEEFIIAKEPTFHILERFRELDLDHNGLLSIQEAIDIADRLVLPIDAEQVRLIIHDLDRDGDGQITYYEYLGAITHIGFQ